MVSVSFKKMLGLILVVVVAAFGLMLTTSYAWYSYENASTKFDVVTANEDVEIVYQSGEYINTDSAIPIKNEDVDRFSSKYNFNIKVKNYVKDNEMVAKVSLINIVMDEELKEIDDVLGDSPFRVDFFYQGSQVGTTVTGSKFNESTFEIGDVVLSHDVDNQFELRVYLLDSGVNQDKLMNKKFQAKIDVNIISRVSARMKNFDTPDIEINDITVNGTLTNYLPTIGFYDMTATCEKGSHLSWDAVNKTLIYDKGSYLNDKCSLNFVTSSVRRYLKDVLVGSYVSYIGNNGCSKRDCYGENPHYVGKDNMGYCFNDKYHFTTSGFRVMYVRDDTAYLVSAGAVECANNITIASLDKSVLKYCNKSYVFGGKCNQNVVRVLRKSDIDTVIGNQSSYRNELVDNGGYYLYVDDDTSKVFSWNPMTRTISEDVGSNYGVRVVIRMDKDLLIYSGNGTYEDPYVIGK